MNFNQIVKPPEIEIPLVIQISALSNKLNTFYLDIEQTG